MSAYVIRRSRATLLAMTGFALGLSCSRRRKDDLAYDAFPSGLDAKEAPMLAHLVARGELPPLEDRLPERPLVAKHDYEGYERAGVYGGTWHRFHTGPGMGAWKMVGGYAPLVRWKFDCSGLEPGLAESWEFNDDGSALTLHLRRGLKWSDGHPFTSESFAFYYELCLDERHPYGPPVWSRVGGKPMKVTTPDDHTIVMRFAGPNWLVPLWLATGFWWCDVYNIPRHYMIRFHPDRNPELDDFNEFQRRNLSHQNPERPTMWPWRVVRYEKAGYRVVLERNPYYYVVDDLGRQLPYIDRVKSFLVPDPQVRVLKILAGEVDCQYRGADVRDLALFLKGEGPGGYRIRRWTSGSGANPSLLLNWSAPDPVLRRLIRDRRFRKALAFGIDREKCNEIAWRGLLRPQAATISRESWHFADVAGQKLFDEWTRADAQFDIEKGNALLDEMGLTGRDPGGYRLRPDGKRLTIIIDVPSSGLNIQENDTALIVAEGWRGLGIDAVMHTPPGAELGLRRRLGEYTVSARGEAEMDLFTYPDWVFPTLPLYWHPKVGLWYQTGGEKGEAPTGPMKKLLDLYDMIKREEDLRKRHEYVRRAVRIHIDEGPFHLGTAARIPALVVVGDHFHNVAATGILGPWAIAGPATSYPEHCFMEVAR
ncbi:MAG: ABC transporter substrate-binding protein [Planctomycetota bacterium]|jgi:peptide/nickel transport system substrate-binding protein